MHAKVKSIATIRPLKSLPLLIIAFVEGGAVMAAELLSAKMLAPFFGTSLYAWASVLAITLLALATGYYTGGYLTTRYPARKILIVILIISGFLMILMPSLSQWVMMALIHSPLISGLILSLMAFVFPAVFLFGMVSPVIIHLLMHHVDKAGSTSGKVYAVSTIGGVLNTLLMGFYIIPTFGVKGPAMVYGLIVLSLTLLLIQKRPKVLPVAATVLLAFMLMAAQWGKGLDQTDRFNVLYATEGILGQVKVVDIKGMALNGKPMEPRGLIVNNTWQTLYNRSDNENLLDYIYFMKPLLSKYRGHQGEALLVGLGGGMLAREMQKTGLDVEVVEIDGRLQMLARRYFGLDPQMPVIIDDGRRYINQTNKQYKLIILDAFLGENAPWHLLTLECFKTLKHKMSDDGLLLIEFFGHIRNENGKAARSILATLHEAGFRVKLIGTRREEAPDRNLIFVVSNHEFSLENLQYAPTPYAFEPITDLNNYLVEVSADEMQDAYILTDNHPILERLLAGPSLQWRKDLNPVLRDMLLQDQLPLFY